MANKTSKFITQAREKLDSHLGGSLDPKTREREAVTLASLMLKEAIRVQTHKEKKEQEEIARMMKDPKGKAFTMMMTDECFRSRKTRRIADQLIYLLQEFGIPQYLNWFKRLELSLFQKFGRTFHFFLVPLAKNALRKTTSKVILPGEARALSKHMKKRRAQGVRINLNHLGEAILGEKEALHRLNVYLRDLEKPDVEYVSIKISTIFSQINLLDWEGTMSVLKDRLGQLYKKAMEHHFERADGSKVVKFVNLDMEEYRDLELTKAVFQSLLNDEEFLHYSAGIVLQAYIPDSYEILQELTEWAIQRRSRGGAPIKIRIVKGANLTMEQLESSLHHWPQTPYKTKIEVDANYKRMVLYGCKKEHAEAVHLGIASHNLFDIAFAMLVRVENEVKEEVTFEMLEGMADHIRRVVQELTGEILLYCPVATKEDFQSAIAYLIRRLDENTGPENFLRHSFGLKPGTETWDGQAALFTQACEKIDTVSKKPRRRQNRFEEPTPIDIESPFTFEADTDFTLPQNQKWAKQIVQDWKGKSFEKIPLVIDGKEIHRDQTGEGIEPSDPHKTLYEYALATWNDVDAALNVAKQTQEHWKNKSPRERAQILSRAANAFRKKRADLVGVMMKDGGKSIFETEPEISEAIDFIEYYLRSMLSFDAMEEIEFSSLGTILVAPPWNFPVSIPTGGISAALATGNCVIFKPAPEAVLSGWVLVNLFWEAGVPKDVLQFINCVDDPIGSQLIKDKRINAVILTGGTSTARLFMKMRPDLHLCAETGGKNAMIITGMADRDLAIKDLVQSAFGHSGQKCSAASLAILTGEVYDDKNFMRQLKDAVESLRVGPCWDLSSKVIPLIRPPSDALKKGVTKLERGEKWLVEPKQDPNNPHLWSPGVKIGVKEGSFMHQTELFGPVLGVMRAKSIVDAVRIANDTPYGLTSGIQTLDKREIQYWIKKIEAGNCYINRGITGAIVQRQPFGGCKASSFGHSSKAGGPNYILQFMHKHQKSLPRKKASIPKSINTLNDFLDQLDLAPEDLATWFATISSYAYWAKEFAKDHDPEKVVGQDNILRYVPRKKMAFRLQEMDSPFDVYRCLAAALACNTHIELSYDPNTSPIKIDDNWKRTFQEISFAEEVEEAFIERIRWRSFERVRFLTDPSPAIQKAAAEVGVYLNAEPVLATGRLELIHYLREVAFSIDYHRYGNLGLREGEKRSEIL